MSTKKLLEKKYPNGQLKIRSYMLDKQGKYVTDGKFTSWYENGKKELEAIFTSGVEQ